MWIAFVKNHLRTLSTLLLLGFLPGCASLPPVPTEQARNEWGVLILAPARFAPHSNIRSFATGTGAGSAKGAALGATTGIAAAGAFAVAGGPFAAILAPYLAVVMSTGLGVAGAHAGGQAAISEGNVAAIEGVIQDNLSLLDISGTLARTVADTANHDAGRHLQLLATAGAATPAEHPDYQALAREGAENVLEMAVNDVGFTKERQLRFYLVASIRISQIGSGRRLYEREFVYQSDDYESALWGKDKAALFRAEFQRAVASIAESVVEQLFLLTALPPESRAKSSDDAKLWDLLGGRDACGLAWVSPPHDYHPNMSDETQTTWNRFPLVGSRQPTLAWESFPRANDRNAGPRIIPSGISRIRYDLRVWEVMGAAPPRLAYERHDLPAASHTLETPLAAQSRYFWSARARFESGGNTHATKWGYFRVPNYMTRGKVKPQVSPAVVVQAAIAGAAARDVCSLDFIPTNNYYRFKTP